MQDWVGWLTGKPAEFINPVDLLHKTNGREVTRVDSVGIVKIKFNIATKFMKKFLY